MTGKDQPVAPDAIDFCVRQARRQHGEQQHDCPGVNQQRGPRRERIKQGCKVGIQQPGDVIKNREQTVNISSNTTEL